ncbi:VOC family protein [Streptosporangium sp. NPDC048047]|uniref:VOC family protein n=1 Tax=Streptosporangium sp. NPDC048047 TaxID=3155748 RepID=UPI0034421FCD
MTVNRVVTNILSDRLPETRDFFARLLDLKVNFDEDWYVQLSPPDDPRLEVGIWRRDHELIPEAHRGSPAGTILTFVVDDVDAVHERALGMGCRIVSPPSDRFYGQRGFMVLDPNGLVVDVSTPVRNA